MKMDILIKKLCKAFLINACSILLICIAGCNAHTKPQPQVLNNPELIRTANSLPLSGTLQRAEDGYVYLKVSNQFISTLYPELKQHLNANETKCLQPDPSYLGAHATILYAEDPTVIPNDKFIQSYSFTVGNVYKITLKRKKYGDTYQKTYYFLKINSPELINLLRQLDPGNKEITQMHITIAIDYRYPDNSCFIRDQ